MFHVDVASAYVAMRRIPYKIINECHSKCFAAILVSDPVPVPASGRVPVRLQQTLPNLEWSERPRLIRIVCQHCPHIWRQY